MTSEPMKPIQRPLRCVKKLMVKQISYEKAFKQSI